MPPGGSKAQLHMRVSTEDRTINPDFWSAFHMAKRMGATTIEVKQAFIWR